MEHQLVTGLNLSGEGHIEGRREGVPFALPGDAYDVAKGQVVPQAPERQVPPCAHFGSCGGCALQHANDSFVAEWKLDITRRALAAHGLETEFRPIVTSPLGSRRRAVFAGRRTKKTTQVGFHARRSDVLVPISECAVLDPRIMAGLPLVHALVRLGASRSGNVRVAVTASEGGLDVAVSEAKALGREQIAELPELVAGSPLARLSWNDEVLMRLQPAVQRFGRALVEPPAGAFLQATEHGEAALLAGIREAIGDARRVVDLFAGCGTFSLPVAEAADVLAVESDAAMLAALDAGWRQAEGLRAVSVETRDLYRRPLLAAEFKGYDAAIIDPPRAGAAAQVAELAQSAVSRVGFAACNPVSFARDAKLLVEAGFALDWLQVVDQFRWSPHVELVARFSR